MEDPRTITPELMRSRSVSMTERSPSASRPSRRADSTDTPPTTLADAASSWARPFGHACLEVPELLLELLLLVEKLLQALRQLERRDLEQTGRFAEGGLLRPHVPERGLSRDRLDAAHSRSHRALGHDLEEPDLARGLEMSAPAQLGGEIADADDADAIAVLLAEERPWPRSGGRRSDPSRPA